MVFTMIETALGRLRVRRGPDSTRGIVPGLIVADPGPGWMPASALVSGERLDELLDAAKQRWGAAAPAAAALAWRSYTYWLTMPTVLGWATARQVPLVDPDDLLVRITISHDRPLLTMGLRSARLAVLEQDLLAPQPGVMIVTSEDELLRQLRESLREGHLDRLLVQLQARVRLGARTLLGSLASAVGYAVVRGVDAPPDELDWIAHTLLSALSVSDLVELEPGQNGPTVRRRTCCLAFTLPEPKICSGCCLPASLNPVA